MKYFTKEWCFGLLDENETERQMQIYENYINEIFPALPFPLKLLAKDISLHDGILNSVCFSRNSNKLYLKGVFGDLEMGYFSLKIAYFGVSNLNVSMLESIFNNKELTILRDEIERCSSDCFFQRMIFSNKESIEIKFEDIEIFIKKTTARSYKKKKCKLKLYKH